MIDFGNGKEMFERICEIIGDGDSCCGERILNALADRLIHARKKHPGFMPNAYQGIKAVYEEYQELEYAVHNESIERQDDEALDVMVTALRMYAHEYKKHSSLPE